VDEAGAEQVGAEAAVVQADRAEEEAEQRQAEAAVASPIRTECERFPSATAWLISLNWE
jgi:hypothetical protein